MNNINLTGRITKEPELRTIPSGNQCVLFILAVDRGYKDANGEKITDFIPCIAWNTQATFIGNYVNKGNLLEVSGMLTTRKYQNDSGETKTIIEVLVNKVSNLTPKPKEETQQFIPNFNDFKEELKNLSEKDLEDDLPF